MLEQSFCPSAGVSSGLLMDVSSLCGDVVGGGGLSGAVTSSGSSTFGSTVAASGVDAAVKNMSDLDDLNTALYDMGAQDLLLDVWDGMDVEVGQARLLPAKFSFPLLL